MDTPVAHVKLSSESPVGASGSLVRRGSRPRVERAGTVPEVREARFLVNARVALPPDDLERLMRSAAQDVLPGADLGWEGMECFQPAPPEPTHRHAVRCGTGDDASCCAAFYERSAVRYLLGDSFHPGGVDLTLRMAERLELEEDDRVLDVACGRATSLKAIRAAWKIRPYGLDAGLPSGVQRSDGVEMSGGNAHDIPFGDAEFDALLCECALSTFADPSRALREMNRVIKPCARLALSDMVVQGPVPTALEDWVHVGTCLSGALDFAGYEETLTTSGFRIIDQWAASHALHEMIGRIKRNLLGLALARTTGTLPEDVSIDVAEVRTLLREAERAVEDGIIGYGVFIAERVD